MRPPCFATAFLPLSRAHVVWPLSSANHRNFRTAERRSETGQERQEEQPSLEPARLVSYLMTLRYFDTPIPRMPARHHRCCQSLIRVTRLSCEQSITPGGSPASSVSWYISIAPAFHTGLQLRSALFPACALPSAWLYDRRCNEPKAVPTVDTRRDCRLYTSIYAVTTELRGMRDQRVRGDLKC